MTDHEVRWTDAARDDLRSIVDYVAEDSPVAAVRCLNRVESLCQGLATQPGRGRVVPELGAVGISIYRELIERPWRIVYRQDKLAHVPAVLDARRDLSSLLLERLVRQ
ncbi:MAG: type II toxin-antitoxin system RelE/ParE family toxin [Gammaproteobacteria bacterium]|nr:type II toxin-antitoxin system RelE/ParE family toxin [Gammaproteobacteria bacterium]MYK84396.1 type II toxin-antitoxin system RelE/ParE family toxin [Gammaproteobacteria bacterium]